MGENSNHPPGAEDLLAALKERNNLLHEAFGMPKPALDGGYSQLEFANPVSLKSRRGQSSALTPKSKHRDVLLINGEKIFFDQSSISSILNVDRISRLVAYKNKIGSSSVERQNSEIII